MNFRHTWERMKERSGKILSDNPRLKKIAGAGLLVIGFVALVTPFTPGAAIFLFLGLEFLGIRFLFVDKLKERFKK